MVSFLQLLAALANMTCQLVKIGSFHPIFTFFEQLERQICKIEATNARLIIYFGNFVFGNLGCMIFFTMVSICKARL